MLWASVASFGAVARDHEQRVVDRDGQPDQHDELARIRADGIDRLAVDAEHAERREQRGHGQDQRDEGRHGRAERDEQDQERQRDRQPERLVETAGDELLDVLVGERSVERVDPEVWLRGPRLVKERPQVRELRLDRGLVAGHGGCDPDGRSVGRDEAGLGWREAWVDDLGERRFGGPIDRGRVGRHPGQHVVERRCRRRVVDRAVRGPHHEQRPMGRVLRARRVEQVERPGGFVGRLLGGVLIDRVGGPRPAHGQARDEQPDRQDEPQAEDRPAVARAPASDADGPGLAPGPLGGHGGRAGTAQTRSKAAATDPPPPRHSVASP